jgi:hypothetical protein
MQCVRSDKVLALGRNPLGALAGRDVHDVHCVDLLEGASLCFTEEEVDDDGAEEVAGGEDVAVAVVDGAGDEGGEEGDEEVLWKLLVGVFISWEVRFETSPNPVRRRGQSHCRGPVKFVSYDSVMLT